jgi:hypothetical protein
VDDGEVAAGLLLADDGAALLKVGESAHEKKRLTDARSFAAVLDGKDRKRPLTLPA